MNILVLSQYFWPEKFRINELVKELGNSKKLDIEVLTAKPSYPTKKIFKNKKLTNFGKIKVHRVPLYLRNGSMMSKVFNYITFVIGATLSILFFNKKKYDIIFVFQVSPIFSAIPAVIYSKFNKTKIYIWVLDLWPESISVFGFNSKIFFSMIKKISDYIYSSSDILLAQSYSLVKILKKRYQKKTLFLPNWCEDIFEKKINSGLDKKIKMNFNKKKINIFFGGNIGKAQDFDSIIKTIEIINKKSKKFNWFIFGDGSEKPKIKNYIESSDNIKNVFFYKTVAQSELLFIFKKYSDLLLVSLSHSKTLKWTIPGKIQFYFQCKKPIIGMLNGEANLLIKKSNSGFVVKSGDYLSFSKLLINLSKSNKKNFLKSKGINGYNFSKKYFNKKKIINELQSNLII